ncbi:MAG: AGE family epimerase/isomerase [Propionibacteriaceae bacterium]|nr:AGE family epimerase/isomerase [Propionibacteriaceae bacterium]
MIPGSPQYRVEQRADLLRFGSGSVTEGGFGYLDDAGTLDPREPMPLYVVCRMTHVFSLGFLADEAPAEGGPDRSELARLAEHGVRELTQGPLHDARSGGWFAAIQPDGSPDSAKAAYAHAFVVLAATSAVAAGVPGAQRLLDMALDVMESRFWDEATGTVVEQWDSGWTSLDDYRGVNANMHTVEAFLAAGDVTGDTTWHTRAGRIAQRIVGLARDNEWRIPEHLDSQWRPMLEYNRDQPADPFRPYGATVGHGMEWSRLLVAVHESLGKDAPEGLVEAAIALNDRAIADGWAVDGADGFVYTTDWNGTPVVRARMHWVAAEAICTAAVLHRVTGESRYAEDLQRWWDYVDAYLVDHDLGSWHHELDAANRPASETWSGKPDVYHAYQAALVEDLPTTPSFATALAAR